jgi:hypothetical protein
VVAGPAQAVVQVEDRPVRVEVDARQAPPQHLVGQERAGQARREGRLDRDLAVAAIHGHQVAQEGLGARFRPPVQGQRHQGGPLVAGLLEDDLVAVVVDAAALEQHVTRLGRDLVQRAADRVAAVIHVPQDMPAAVRQDRADFEGADRLEEAVRGHGAEIEQI